MFWSDKCGPTLALGVWPSLPFHTHNWGKHHFEMKLWFRNFFVYLHRPIIKFKIFDAYDLRVWSLGFYASLVKTKPALTLGILVSLLGV